MSLNCVKERAQKLDVIRHSPQIYSHVKSRVGRNLKTQKKNEKAERTAKKGTSEREMRLNKPSTSPVKKGVMTAKELQNLQKKGMC